MNAKQSDRRRFLKDAALAGLGVGAIRSASGQTTGSETPEVRPKDSRAYGERSRFDNTVREPISGPFMGVSPLMTPLQDLAGIITPSPLHFLHSHGSSPPDIDPRQHRLLIHGMVERPMIFTMEELKRLPAVNRIYFLECNANSRPLRGPNAESVQKVHGHTSCSEWTGVLLSVLLRESGVQKGANWLVAEGAETRKYTTSIPLEKGMEDTLVAYAQNGEAVRPEQGFPLRLVIPGFEAIRSVKWLRRIKVADQPIMGRHETGSNAQMLPDGKAYWFNFRMGVKSVIIHPSAGERLTDQKFYDINGLAWSGGGAVRRVEVSTDGGRTWKDAELQEPVLRFAHTRFRFPWNWDGEEAVLQSRCTDERGEVQPTMAELGRIWGVDSDFFQNSGVDYFNAIQPWKVNRDGSVQNALFL